MGEAFSLAREYDLKPVSVQNYEMLEDVLKGLKKRGSAAFVGICCEAFMAKHRDDFERIGLPGILIDVDNSTCYDLGKEQEAHQGHFENQTRLKLDLLKRVLAHLKRSTIEKRMML
jgi:lipoate-protein ligase A